MKNLIILSYGAALPDQNASALRIASVAKALAKSGYTCYVIGQAPFAEGQMRMINSNFYLFSIYNYLAKNTYLNKIRTFLFPTKKIFSAINTVIHSAGTVSDFLVYQQLPPCTTKKLIKYVRNKKSGLYFDIVEFQTISQQSFFTFFQFFIPNYLTVKKWAKQGKIISISTYLNNYFLGRKIQSVFVPFFFDVAAMPFYKKSQLFNGLGKIELIYAGCPSRGRDTIVNAIKGILLLPTEFQRRISLTIAGASQKTFLDLGLSKKDMEASQMFANFIGKVAHERIVSLYETACFSIYLKPAKKRFSKAGFPTKVSESLAFGTPVIANISGDVGAFLVDGDNSIIISDDSPQSFCEGVLRIFKLQDFEMEAMSKQARTTAEEELSLKKYSSVIGHFFGGEKE